MTSARGRPVPDRASGPPELELSQIAPAAGSLEDLELRHRATLYIGASALAFEPLTPGEQVKLGLELALSKGREHG